MRTTRIVRGTAQAKACEALVAGRDPLKRDDEGRLGCACDALVDLGSLTGVFTIAANGDARLNFLRLRARDFEWLGIVDLDDRAPSQRESLIERLLVVHGDETGRGPASRAVHCF